MLIKRAHSLTKIERLILSGILLILSTISRVTFAFFIGSLPASANKRFTLNAMKSCR